MAEYELLKCKACGAPIDIASAEAGVIKCEYCLEYNTVPKKETEPEALMLIRSASALLYSCDFDKAYDTYMQASQVDGSEPEAYFGMALSEHKVQYIKDEVAGRYQPICHELKEAKFAENKNYIKALELSTPEQREQYATKAREIDDIRKELVKIKNSGLKYDCFICTKVTGEDGKKTDDSARANDIYYYLKDKGFKPFYSEREVQNRTGVDYEALILYALHSSTCMIVVCSNEEYLRTPWVKNEYTRFIKMINDEDKADDSITIVFGGTPIERLPGKSGKIQGVDAKKMDAMSKIEAFVRSHAAVEESESEDEIRKKIAAEVRAEYEKEQLEKRKAEIRAEEEKKLYNEAQQTDEEPESAEEEIAASELDENIEVDTKLYDMQGSVLVKYKGNDSKVVIPDGVKKIKSEAFCECDSLTSLTIPSTVEVIEKGAVKDCNKLTSISVPFVGASKSSKEYSHFGYIFGAKDNFENAYYVPNSLKTVTVTGGTSIGDRAFKGLNNITDVNLPSSVTSIGSSAFYECGSLTSVNMGKSVTNIEANAFGRCGKLSSIKLPDTLKSIGNYAFEGCGKLSSIKIPDSVTSIGEGLFEDCGSLKKVSVPKNLKEQAEIKNIFGRK